MPIVEIVAIAVIATIALAFAVVLATEVSQRRELRRLRGEQLTDRAAPVYPVTVSVPRSSSPPGQ